MLRVHSIQSLGTLDGPGVRFVVFLQGCNLRCKCCHNPDTWDMSAGTLVSIEELFSRAVRYREYFGKQGGITLSGGEPLLQADAISDLFSLCREAGINTCIDTSGSVMNEDVKRLLTLTDRVLLDIKYTNSDDYLKYAGCFLDKVMDFLSLVDSFPIPTTLRQVIIPTINDSDENIEVLKKIRDTFSCVDSVELLAFRKLCETKYESLSIPFPFAHIPEPSRSKMDYLSSLL